MIGPRSFHSLPWGAICLDYKWKCDNMLDEHPFETPTIAEFQLSYPE